MSLNVFSLLTIPETFTLSVYMCMHILMNSVYIYSKHEKKNLTSVRIIISKNSYIKRVIPLENLI